MLLKNPNPDFLPVHQDDEFLPPVIGATIFGGLFLVGKVAIAFTISAPSKRLQWCAPIE